MKAIYRGHGQDLQVPTFCLNEEVTIPVPGTYEVKVAVKACGLSIPSNKLLNKVFRKQPSLQYPVGQEIAGVVTEIGPNVTTLDVGHRVTGVLPLDSLHPGCAEYCVTSEHNLVKLPAAVGFKEAAACIGDAVKIYTALQYQGQARRGETLLLLDGATSPGIVAIQLARAWGIKVITTASTDQEKYSLEEYQPTVAQVIELKPKNHILVNSVMEETGGLGADIIIDSGVQQFQNEDEPENVTFYPRAFKHDIISCLGVGGRWVTTQIDLQLDPPDSEQLFLRGASVSFLFEQVWTLSPKQYGCYRHILLDVVNKLAAGVIKPHIRQCASFENALDVLQNLPTQRIGKAVLEIE